MFWIFYGLGWSKDTPPCNALMTHHYKQYLNGSESLIKHLQETDNIRRKCFTHVATRITDLSQPCAKAAYKGHTMLIRIMPSDDLKIAKYRSHSLFEQPFPVLYNTHRYFFCSVFKQNFSCCSLKHCLPSLPCAPLRSLPVFLWLPVRQKAVRSLSSTYWTNPGLLIPPCVPVWLSPNHSGSVLSAVCSSLSSTEKPKTLQFSQFNKSSAETL